MSSSQTWTIKQAYEAIESFLAAGNDQAASAMCAGIRESRPGDPFATFSQGVIAWRRGLHDTALTLMREAVETGSLNPKASYVLGTHLQERGHLTEAEKYLVSGLSIEQVKVEAAHRLTDISTYRGVCYQRINENRTAFTCFKNAVDYAGSASMRPATVKSMAQGLWYCASATGVLTDSWRRVANTLSERFGPACIAGPFKGMRLWDDVDLLQPNYLIGSYEHELTDIIEAVASNQNYDAFIDVGTYHGYYAVGMARRMPQAKVYGFEVDDGSRAVCERLAQLNGVAARMDLRGACDPAGLSDACSGAARPFVLVDCEGYEKTLVDLDAVPELRGADLLIETHDFIEPGVTDLIVERLAGTHETQVIGQQPGEPNRYPLLDGFDHVDRWLAVAERRPNDVGWVYAKAKR